ncbi:TRAP transporter substrate-binding protein DctP [uncultured Vibrio sp.]|uniref:TRAP transporter substrate-binding protein DctP n=1 Tax=uncultured Vibrio sp. TaxID=114054 RepID=UPI00261F9A7A|nr:TRAP transporter substrate-binding protein DctP [uncultured Vibrio sp.]
MTKIKKGLLTLIATTLCAPVTLAETYNWKMQTIWSGGSTQQQIIEQFSHNVQQQTNGEINIEVLANGAIVPYNQSLQFVKMGVLQMHKSGPCFYSGLDTAFGLLCDLTAAYDSPAQFMGWYRDGGGIELARELYEKYGLYYIGPVLWGTESLPSKVAINSVDDFKGLKVRMPEGPSSDLFRSIGAAPVTVPGSEVYTSLDKGVVDAADWGTLSMNVQTGLHDVAPYALYPGIHATPASDVAINLALWNQLSKRHQQILEEQVTVLSDQMVETFTQADNEAAASAAENGITLIDWSPEERAKFKVAAQKVWEKYASKSPMAQKIYDSQFEYLTKIGAL